MDRRNIWLILTIVSFIVFLISTYISYKTGRTEYALMIGSMLFGIGCGSSYQKMKRK